MWEQWWQTIQQWGGKTAAIDEEDPEQLLARAQAEMRQLHAQNRERAVRAITQKNRLQQMVRDTERQVDSLREQEDEARRSDQLELALQLCHEAENYEHTLALTQSQLESAEETAEQVKAAIKRDEERIRQKTAHALALRAQWNLVKIEQAITVSLAQISTGSDARLTREQVRERHERNREYAAEAFTQKNDLQQMVDSAEETVARLREKAVEARGSGDDEREHELLRVIEQQEATLAQSRDALLHAIAVADRARELVEEEASRIRLLGEAYSLSSTITPQRTVISDEDDPELPFLLVVAALSLLACAAVLWWLMRAGSHIG